MYKEDLTSIIAGAAGHRYQQAELVCKHFFSGAALYVDGRICITLTPVGLALKLPEQDRSVLLKDFGAKPLRYFPKAPVKKKYVLLHKTTLQNTRQLRRWIRKSIEHVLRQKPVEPG